MKNDYTVAGQIKIMEIHPDGFHRNCSRNRKEDSAVGGYDDRL